MRFSARNSLENSNIELLRLTCYSVMSIRLNSIAIFWVHSQKSYLKLYLPDFWFCKCTAAIGCTQNGQPTGVTLHSDLSNFPTCRWCVAVNWEKTQFCLNTQYKINGYKDLFLGKYWIWWQPETKLFRQGGGEGNSKVSREGN